MTRTSLRFIVLSCLLLICADTLRASIYETMQRGRQLSSCGRYHDALASFDSVIASTKTRSSLLLEALDSRARCHKQLANYSLSLDDYNRALSINASKTNLSIVSLNKTDLLLQIGRYADAENILDNLEDLNPSIRNRRLSNLASVYVRTGRYDRAEELYKTLIEEDSTGNSVTFQNLGFLYMMQGNWNHAVRALKRAYLSFPDDTPDKFIALSNLALTEAFSAFRTDATMHIEEAIKNLIRLLGPNHPDVITAKRKQGEIYLALNDKSIAFQAFKEYFEHNSKNILSTFGSLTTQGRLDFWKKERPLLSLCFGLESTNPEFLFDVALFRRSIALLGNGQDYKRLLSVKGKDIQQKLKTGYAAVDFVVYPKRNDSGKLIDYMGAIVATKSKIDFVTIGKVSDIENHKVNGIRLKTAISSGRQNHINAIYADSILTELIWSRVLDKINNERHVYFVPDGILNLLAAEYLPGLPMNISFHRLTSLVNLTQRNSKVNNGKFLLAGGLDYNNLDNEISKSSIPNHQAVEFLKENINNVSFSTLQGMKEEVEEIYREYPDATITTTLSEESFKNRIKEFNRLHISSHGYTLHIDEPEQAYMLSDSIMADRSLLASGLVLTGANIAYNHKDREDGLLSARELCDMDMSNVDFIVLSACQTADGKISDEGPAGLVRGLKKAGANTIVATLWEVDDSAARMFMTKFYQLRKKGIGISQAFKKSREFLINYSVEEPEMIAEYDPAIQATRIVETGEIETSYPMAAPSMWAPFILIDNIEY